MLHVHGGSVVLDKLKAASLPGEFLEWSEALCQGPLPGGLAPEAWRAARAAWLEHAYVPDAGAPPGPALPRLAAQEAALDDAREEIVLWFSADWFCQAILVYLLQRLGGRKSPVSLISVDRHPGVDDRNGCTLAFLSDDQLHRLFEHRAAVTPAQTELARRTWDALTARTPELLLALTLAPTRALPFLSPCLRRHLQEFPAPRVGLGLTEFHVLEVMGGRTMSFSDLFPGVAEREPRRWITDTMLWAMLQDLARAPVPLLTIEPGERLFKAQLRLTQAGRDVLGGRADAIALRGIDKWIGGVHLREGAVWRWDDRAKQLLPPV